MDIFKDREISVSKTIWGRVPSGTDDIKDIYRKWAPSYEDNFADKWGYVAPNKIANLFLKNFRVWSSFGYRSGDRSSS